MSDEMTPKEGTLVSGPEGGHRPGGGQETRVRSGRFRLRYKVEAVLRLLRASPWKLLNRELVVSAAKTSQWREDFLSRRAQTLSGRPGQDGSEAKRLNAIIGELTMANELLNEKIGRLEQNHPLALQRSKK